MNINIATPQVQIRDGSQARESTVYDGVVLPRSPTATETVKVIQAGAWESAAAHCQLKGYNAIAVVSDAIIERHFGEYLRRCLGANLTLIDGPTAKKRGENSLAAYALKGLDVIIGLGGGTNIDQAKMFAKRSNLPWLALPTKPTAAILSGHASVIVKGRRTSEPTPLAEGVFIDRSLFKTVDPLCVKSEFGDSLSSLSAVGDAYLSNLDQGTPLQGRLLKDAYQVASRALEINTPQSSQGILRLYQINLKYAEIMNAYGTSLPCSGSEHAVSHALDTLGSSQLHGIQVGFTTLVGTRLQEPFRDLSDRFQDEGIQRVSTEELRDTLERQGFPTRLSQLGISREKFEEALHRAPTVRATDDRRYTVLDRYEVRDAVANLVRAGLV